MTKPLKRRYLTCGQCHNLRYTPRQRRGEDALLECDCGWWRLDPCYETIDDLRRYLETAKTCDDFRVVEE